MSTNHQARPHSWFWWLLINPRLAEVVIFLLAVGIILILIMDPIPSGQATPVDGNADGTTLTACLRLSV